MNKIVLAPTNHLSGLVSEQPFHRRTLIDHDGVLIEHRDNIHRTLGQRLEASFGGFERLRDLFEISDVRKHTN